MGVVGLDHVQLAIPAGGEDRARWFFGGLLGMTEVPKPANLSSSGCWFTGGSMALHIGPRRFAVTGYGPFSEEEIIPALTTPMHLVRLESAFRKWISILEGVIY